MADAFPLSPVDERRPALGGGGRGLPPPPGEDDGPSGVAGDPTRLGLLLFLGTVTMLFIGFTSAYVLRRASADWRPLAPPPFLWANTAVLLLSSALLQVSRARLDARGTRAARPWLAAAGLLGLAFLAGQVGLWRELVAGGAHLRSGPHPAFFFVLSGTHAAHLLGGLVWFAVAAVRARRWDVAEGRGSLSLLALYWHFLGLVWLYLVLLLFVL